MTEDGLRDLPLRWDVFVTPAVPVVDKELPPGENYREWMTALDTIESLHPRAVIAGHKRPESDDSPKTIEETGQYIRDFDRLASATTTAQELYEKMLGLYPDRLNRGAL